ncbi:643_t:CDS:2 [Ambispora leptoticha]|uniref:643_t:CDS:1 n=1 Tax=Ambispora leptoticha TaxID=144679 RepID=A0A9N8ZXR3_9GLOM|nr:643_t:CDS:2 [Ambispora leptoticha]
MGSSLSRQERALSRKKSFQSNRSSHKSYDSSRRKSCEEKVNGCDHAYRKDNPKFAIPENTRGISRLEVQHYLMRYLYQNNFSSPQDPLLKPSDNNTVSQVLDLGCGAGTWAIDVAKEFPSCQVTGVDISSFFPIEFDKENVPNVRFIEHNFQENKRLPFDDDTFDLVHMRFLLADIKEQDFENFLIPELVRVTKLNGWIELLEFDVQQFSEGPITRQLTSSLMKYLKSNGYNGRISDNLPQYLRNTHKVGTINQHDKAIALGRWAGRVGELAIDDISRMFRDIKELPQSMGITEQEYREFLEVYKKEVELKKTFFKTHRFYTQKIDGDEPQPTPKISAESQGTAPTLGMASSLP